MALKVLEPSLPSGGAANVAKTVVKDTASAGYVVAVVAIAAAGVGALLAYARRKNLVPSGASAAANQVQSWFGA